MTTLTKKRIKASRLPYRQVNESMSILLNRMNDNIRPHSYVLIKHNGGFICTARWLFLLLLIVVFFQVGCERQVSSVKNKQAEEILKESGVKGGFVVHIGCGDGRLTAALCANLTVT